MEPTPSGDAPPTSSAIGDYFNTLTYRFRLASHGVVFVVVGALLLSFGLQLSGWWLLAVAGGFIIVIPGALLVLALLGQVPPHQPHIHSGYGYPSQHAARRSNLHTGWRHWI